MSSEWGWCTRKGRSVGATDSHVKHQEEAMVNHVLPILGAHLALTDAVVLVAI